MDDPIGKLFDSYPEDIQAIAGQLRSLVKSAMPGAYESIYHGALSYSLGQSAFERLVYLALEKKYVRLGFNFGRYLPDPEHLLVGEGKRLRHGKVDTLSEVDKPALKQLVQDAWKLGRDQLNSLKKDLESRRSGK